MIDDQEFEEGRCYNPDLVDFRFDRNIRARKNLWVGVDECIYTTKKDALRANGEKSKVIKMRWSVNDRRYVRELT